MGSSFMARLPDKIIFEDWLVIIAAICLFLFLLGILFLLQHVRNRARALEAEIARREQVAHELQQRQHEMETLQEITRRISQETDIRQVLASIGDEAIQLLDGSECYLFRLDERELILHIDLARGEHTADTLGLKLKIGEGLTGYAVAHNQPLLVNNAQNDPRAVPIPGTIMQPEEHVIIAPLAFRDRITGAMLVNRHNAAPFNQKNLDLLVGLAQQAATAIEHARLVQELEQHNLMLEHMVTERTAELQRANERLSNLGRLKDEFVSSVSHELRTPITNLKLRQYLLQNTPPDRWPEHLAVAGREIDRLEALVEDLLTLNRLDQDRLSIQCEPVNINTLAEQYGSDRASLAETHNLTLRVLPTPGIPPAYADPNLIGQVLSILLTNAFHYTPAGGTVMLYTQTQEWEHQQWTGFSISDTGPGIPKEEQSHLFERFFRGQVGRNSGRPGTGLGLSIAQAIVTRHQGRIEIVSSGIPGQGTTFIVWLPVNAVTANNDSKAAMHSARP